jgi:hypothetical protein
MLPTTDDKAIDTVLEVLQMEREREKVEAEHEEDRDEMDNGTRALAADQDENMTDGVGYARASYASSVRHQAGEFRCNKTLRCRRIGILYNLRMSLSFVLSIQ